MRIFYVKDHNGDLALVFSPTGDPPYKDKVEWMSNNGSSWLYLNLNNVINKTWLPLLDLSNIPEPSWEDEYPMEIHYKPIKCLYTYDT